MISYTAVIDGKDYQWSQSELKQTLEDIKNSPADAVIRKNLQVSNYNRLNRLIHRAELKQHDIKGAISTLFQLKPQFEGRDHKIYNLAMHVLFKRSKEAPKHFNLLYDYTDTWSLIQFGNTTPIVFAKQRWETLDPNCVHQDPTPDQRSSLPIEYSYPDISYKIGKYLWALLEEKSDLPSLDTLQDLIELLSVLDRFNMKNHAHLDTLMDTIESIELDSFKCRRENDKLFLKINDSFIEDELNQILPFKHRIAAIDIRACKTNIPKNLKAFKVKRLICNLKLDFSNPHIQCFDQIKLDCGGVTLTDDFAKIKKAQFEKLVKGGSKTIYFQNKNRLTTKQFVRLLLTIPKNSIHTLECQAHTSISCEQLKSILLHQNQITWLNVNDCTKIADKGEPHPYKYITATCTKLNTLMMDNFPEGSIADILSILASSNLQYASFSNWGNSDIRTDQHFTDSKKPSLEVPNKLETLYLRNCQLNQSLSSFTKLILKELFPTSLKQLYLDGSNFADDVIKVLENKEIPLEILSLKECPDLSTSSLKLLTEGFNSLKEVTITTDHIPSPLTPEKLEKLFKKRYVLSPLKCIPMKKEPTKIETSSNHVFTKEKKVIEEESSDEFSDDSFTKVQRVVGVVQEESSDESSDEVYQEESSDVSDYLSRDDFK